MGTNVYPQFMGQQNSAFSQAGNMAGVQNSNQNLPQTLSNSSTAQSNLITPNQFNNSSFNTASNQLPGQPQTLTGSTPTPSTSQPRTSGGIGKLVGLGLGLTQSGWSLANSGGGNIYSAGLMGGSLVNYGFRNGFNF
jgi:hypothetical protein